MTTSYRRIIESVEDLLAKSHYMVAKCRVDGNLTFDGHCKTVEETDNESRCRSLCLRIEKALESCREEEIIGLLEMYDILHRIGYATQPSQGLMSATPSRGFIGTAPSQSFMAHHRNRVYTAWRAGNRNIQESQIYSLLKKSVNGRPLVNTMLKNWVRTLVIYNHFPNVTTHENYRRLALLMREDLRPYLDKARCPVDNIVKLDLNELKWKWYKVNKVEDVIDLSTATLKAYGAFCSSLFPSLIDYRAHRELNVTNLSELSSRIDISIWERRAYHLQLEEIRNMIPRVKR